MKKALFLRILPLAVLLWAFVLSCAGAPYSVLLDHGEQTLWRAWGGYVFQADVDAPGVKPLGLAEFFVDGGLFYFQTSLGELDVRPMADGIVFVDGGGLALPNQVASAQLGLQWLWRGPEAWALRLSAHPGIYSDWRDLSGDDLFVPFGADVIWSPHPQVSLLAGVEIFPGYRRDFDPRLGLRWLIHESLVLDLFYPESRLTFTPNLEWEVYAGAGMYPDREWRLRSQDERRRLILDENRLFAGFSLLLLNDLRVRVEGGEVFGRQLDFKKGQPVDIEEAWFLRAGVSSVY